MNELSIDKKVFIKSKNSISNIYNKYTISLIAFIILSLIIYYLSGNQSLVLPIIKSLLLSLGITSVIAYLINIFKKDYNFIHIYTKDYYHLIALTIGLFSINISIYVLLTAIILSLLINTIQKRAKISSSLYGILLILLYKYYQGDLITPLTNFQALSFYGTKEEVLNDGVLNYIIGLHYLNPIIPIFSFIYLFHKKVIKYNIVFSFFLTFFMIMFIYGIFNNMNFWFVFFQITTGSVIFMTVYLLPDTGITPTTSEGGIIYGIILGIITAILRFIIPELSVIVSLIIGSLLLTKFIEIISFKLKENRRLYYLIVILCIMLIVASIIVLSLIY